MEALRQWAICLIISGMAGTLISLLSPRGTMEKTLRAVIGVFIVAAVCSPLSQLKNSDDILPAFAFGETDYADAGELGEQMLEACRNTVGETVRAAAAETGIGDYTVETDAYIDENCCIIIQEIRVVIPPENADLQNGFSAALQERLGVPVTVECS